MNVLVIGSEGNIGRYLVPYLRTLGHEVLCSDVVSLDRPDYCQADIVNPGDLAYCAREAGVEVIYNLAAMVSRVTCEAAPHLAIDRNLCGLNNVIQMAKDLDAKFVAFSTSEVYGNQEGFLSESSPHLYPGNRYALTKKLGEEIVKYEVGCGLDAVIVRPFMLYSELEDMGSHRSAMVRFAHDLSLGMGITVHKDSARGWLHMEDAVIALERVMRLPMFSIINIANPRTILTAELARMFCDAYGLNYRDHVCEVPLPPRMTLVKVPDTRRQKELLDFSPRIDIEEGVKRLVGRFHQ